MTQVYSTSSCASSPYIRKGKHIAAASPPSFLPSSLASFNHSGVFIFLDDSALISMQHHAAAPQDGAAWLAGRQTG